MFLAAATAGAPPHDWLTLTGGAIGQGLPLAAGAAIASPGQQVIALEADGSAMYTIQALWTYAREGLDVTTVIFSNRRYAILAMELQRVGTAAAGDAARNLLDLSRPALDFTALAAGMGVPAVQGHHRDGIRRPIGQGPSRTRPPPHRSRNPLTTRPAAPRLRPAGPPRQPPSRPATRRPTPPPAAPPRA